mmetsp:Transcript_60994/g.147545  ORF Transcript_60994/g.147545 Transcript_60994/m.147545 type:complete len:108 (+) Transcript_60994:703-1026(+)
MVPPEGGRGHAEQSHCKELSALAQANARAPFFQCAPGTCAHKRSRKDTFAGKIPDTMLLPRQQPESASFAHWSALHMKVLVMGGTDAASVLHVVLQEWRASPVTSQP